MVHPYKENRKDTAIESTDQINVTLEMCTLYKGVPHGIASINYTDTRYSWEAFRGVGVFHNGQLHNAPFTYLRGDGWPLTYSKMHNGRPADGSYHSQFNKDGRTDYVDSWEERIQVGGW